MHTHMHDHKDIHSTHATIDGNRLPTGPTHPSLNSCTTIQHGALLASVTFCTNSAARMTSTLPVAGWAAREASACSS